MSVWQYMAAIEGFRKFHTADDDQELSSDEADELWELVRGL